MDIVITTSDKSIVLDNVEAIRNAIEGLNLFVNSIIVKGR